VWIVMSSPVVLLVGLIGAWLRSAVAGAVWGCIFGGSTVALESVPSVIGSRSIRWGSTAVRGWRGERGWLLLRGG
jgi:hypothetical protein